MERERYHDIVQDPFFLRLHNIKQMGLTNYVFPDALHTRFSHSLGVYYIVDKMIFSQENNYGIKVMNEEEKDLLLMSALLHDIGHFPLSHTIEKALKNFDSEHRDDFGIDTDGIKIPDDDPPKLHEMMGEHVLEHTGLKDKLRERGFKVSDVANRFQGFVIDEEIPLKNLPARVALLNGRNFLHSQLDADRIDYLLRDAGFTGVKSGSFDFDKLLEEIRYDDKGRYGINTDGVRVLEQFFMARFAAYMQIPFNKKVNAFDYMACDLYYRLLKLKLDKPRELKNIYNYNDLVSNLQNGHQESFLNFTDNYFFGLIEKVLSDYSFITDGDLIKRYAKLLCQGTPLRLVYQEEVFCSENEWKKKHKPKSIIEKIRNDKEQFAKQAQVNPDDVIIPDTLSVEIFKRKEPSVRKKDTIHIFPENDKPIDILDCPSCLLKSVMGRKAYINRIFTFEPETEDKIKKAIASI
jgi:HD superfamily phosphohydrolase